MVRRYKEMMIGFGFVGMLLFWGALLVLLVGGGALTLRQATAIHSPSGRHQGTARQILDERLARGELTQEDYEAIRARIEP
jgi:uncharacterized membrane protein